MYIKRYEINPKIEQKQRIANEHYEWITNFSPEREWIFEKAIAICNKKYPPLRLWIDSGLKPNTIFCEFGHTEKALFSTYRDLSAFWKIFRDIEKEEI